MEGNAGEAVAGAHEAVSEAIVAVANQARETADETVVRALNEAEAELSEAQRTAEQIAQAALQTELMTQFNAFKQEIRQWLDSHEIQAATMQTLDSRLTTAEAQLSALALVQVSQPSQSTPPISAPAERVQEAIQETAEILPESLSESAVVESPVAPTRQKTRRWI